MHKYFTKYNIYFPFQNVSYVNLSSVFLFINKSSSIFSSCIIKDYLKRKLKEVTRMNLNLSMKAKEEEEIQLIIHHWIRTFNIQSGWVKDFDKLVVNYASTDTFHSSSKLINTFTGYTDSVYSIDFSTFDDCRFICSGSRDKTVHVCDVDNNKQIQSFNGHSDQVSYVKFSQYYYHNHHQNVIYSSSFDRTIRFCNIKYSQQLQIFNGHTDNVCSIEFSPFNGGRYLCSGSYDETTFM
ncbi:WD-40 repeat protein [Reticulomyxa filosa]|uniref:WD-40 repeat protein n=1 Tax=Reticulomyxa filosa TaxID=46433 RepID=X6LGG2_RETFI|nr:WD-40 repeat protein [Reticulomyxa filosa]|eukprot:ETN99809.1 WD-40 repeat protein [Reticulomyxa filosa]